MSFLFKKQEHIELGVESFLNCLERSVDIFVSGMSFYLDSGLGQGFDKSVELAHRAESEADDKRVELQRSLYKNELLPDSRSDLLMLLEVSDKIANRIEDVMFAISIRQIEPFQDIIEDFRRLIIPVEESVRTVIEAIKIMFHSPDKIHDIVEKVDELESRVDDIAHEIIRKIYGMDLDLSRKIQLDWLITHVADIADIAEVTASRLDIIAIKRTL